MNQGLVKLKAGLAWSVNGIAPLRALFLRLALDRRLLRGVVTDGAFLQRTLHDPDVQLAMKILLSEEKFIHRLVLDDQVLDRLLVDKKFIPELGRKPRFLEQLVKLPQVMTRLADHPALAGAIGPHAGFAGRYLKLGAVQRHLLGDEALAGAYLKLLLVRPGALSAVLAHPVFAEGIWKHPKALAGLLGDDRFLAHLLANKPALAALARRPEFAAALADDAGFVAAIIDGPLAPQLILENRQLLSGLLADDAALDLAQVALLNSETRLRSVLAQPAAGRQLAHDPKLLGLLLQLPELSQRIIVDAGVQAGVLRHAGFLKRLGQETETLAQVLTTHSLLRILKETPELSRGLLEEGGLLKDAQLRGQLLASDVMLACIDRNVDFQRALLLKTGIGRLVPAIPELAARISHDPRFVEQLTGDESFIVRFIADEKVHHKIAGNDALASSIIMKRLGLDRGLWKRVLKSLDHDQLVDWLRADEPLMARLLGDPAVTERLARDESFIVRFIADKRIHHKIAGNDALAASIIMERLGRVDGLWKRVLKSLDRKQLADWLRADEPLMARLLDDPAVTERLARDESFIVRFIGNERVHQKIAGNDALAASIIMKRLGQDPDLWKRVLKSLDREQLAGHLSRDAALLDGLLHDPILIERLAGDESFVIPFISHERVHRKIANNDALSASILGRRLGGDDALWRRLARERPFLEGLAARPQVCLSALVESGGIDQPAIRRAGDARIRYGELLDRLAPWFLPLDPVDPRRRQVERELTEPAKVPEAVCSVITRGRHALLGEGQVEYTDRHSLWTQINEIFLDEDYYFETGRERPVILDCGAHIGLATHYFKRLHPQARVVAFEPAPDTFQMLSRNIHALGLEGVQLHQVALGGADGVADFHLSRDYPMANSLTTRRHQFGDTLETVQVEVRRLSSFLDGPVDFLKLDIEGSEQEVLAECGDALRRVHHLFIEIHLGEPGQGDRLLAILALLEQQGFTCQIAKAHNYQIQSQVRPMKWVRQCYSLNIWGVNESFGTAG